MNANAEIIQEYYQSMFGRKYPGDLSAYESRNAEDLMAKMPQILDKLYWLSTTPAWYRRLYDAYLAAYGEEWAGDPELTQRIVLPSGHAVASYIKDHLDAALEAMHAEAVKYTLSRRSV